MKIVSPESEEPAWKKGITPVNVLMVSAAVVTVWPVVAPYIRQFLQWLLTLV